ncbi:PepSY-associated TM helix domain-containing protein [Methylocystis iwaonis]|uniref:Sulfite reductase n=1 Tax=Methylocystis iwaonis TaxID=2885079 RepID=A0ABM8EEL7_9HYPH|nr:PepSY-associated TM helix domain-containing protein [Methylocystis iwaonis]BDV36384.1 sulfite reductase [Methylocystis iwaonis]
MLLHRWVGLVAGALLVLIGLTGSFNVFYREIDAALNPALYNPLGSEHNVTAAEAMQAAAAADPAPITSIIAPDKTWPVWIAIHAPDKGSHSDLWTTMIDPSNGAVLGRRDYTNAFAFTIYRLHSSLLLREWWGRELVGVLGLCLLCSALSGLYLWWPRPGRVWRSISLRKGVSPQRFVVDIHNAAGTWTLPVLAMIAATGVGIVFPDVMRPVISLFSIGTPYPSPKVATPLDKNARKLSADQILERARAAQPGADIALLNPPTESRNTWRVLFRPAGADPALRSRGAIWLDPWTGDIVHARTSDVMSAGDRYVTEQLWLHNGASFGAIGRLAVFASGFAPLVLFVTGFVMWRNKRRARRLTNSNSHRQVSGDFGSLPDTLEGKPVRGEASRAG